MSRARERPSKNILLCAPRGFCAGVDRAIQIVELALVKFGPPVYVRHEIVHNRYVVESLRSKGAVFVEELDEVPEGDAPVIFSAHGVAKSVPDAARAKGIFYLDATCPLVSKVHMEAERRFESGNEILLIGHAGHPEVIGTMGQLPQGTVRLIENVEDAKTIQPANSEKLAYITQTTLSVDDTKEMVGILRDRFPNIRSPHKDDICYATTNRQEAVKKIAPECDAMIVVGAPNSSNSQRLREVAERSGCETAILIQSANEIDWDMFDDKKTVGITAGASAPEILVDEVIEAFRKKFKINVDVRVTATESVSFKLPRELRSAAAE